MKKKEWDGEREKDIWKNHNFKMVIFIYLSAANNLKQSIKGQKMLESGIALEFMGMTKKVINRAFH